MKPKMKKTKAIWAVLACTLTLQVLPTAAATDEISQGGPIVTVDQSLDLKCSGTYSFSATEGGWDFTLLSLWGIRLVDIHRHSVSVRTEWSFTCTLDARFAAHGWGGLLQDVRLQTWDEALGAHRDVRGCRYDGAVQSGCQTALYGSGGSVVASQSGVAPAGSTIPTAYTFCTVEGFYRGVTDVTYVGLYIGVDPRDSLSSAMCVTVAIDYPTADDVVELIDLPSVIPA